MTARFIMTTPFLVVLSPASYRGTRTMAGNFTAP